MIISNSRHLSSIKQERELTKLCFSKSQSNATWYAEPLHQRNRNVYLIYSKWKPNQGASCRAQEWNGYSHISFFKVSIYFHFFPKGFPQCCGNVPVSQEYSRSFRRQAATNNRWVWETKRLNVWAWIERLWVSPHRTRCVLGILLCTHAFELAKEDTC